MLRVKLIYKCSNKKHNGIKDALVLITGTNCCSQPVTLPNVELSRRSCDPQLKGITTAQAYPFLQKNFYGTSSFIVGNWQISSKNQTQISTLFGSWQIVVTPYQNKSGTKMLLSYT